MDEFNERIKPFLPGICAWGAMKEPLRIIEESRRLLKKGGKLLIIDWKKEQTPEGPPMEIRVTEETIDPKCSKRASEMS
jgi:ubiquinone/menaquinone biosynthesis C-methylase UbiE